MKLPYKKTEIQVRFNDLDILGHVSNSIYAQYFDMGRIDWYNIIAGQEKPQRTVVVSIKMDMFDEINIRDEVYVETWCSEIGTRSLTLIQNIYANRIKVTTGTVVSVAIDRETQKSTIVPKHWEISDYTEAQQ